MEPGQAGERVTCRCGTTLDLPTLRQLQSYPREEPPTAPTSYWGLRQQLFLLGLAVLVGVGAHLAFLAATQPPQPKPDEDSASIRQRVMNCTPAESLQLWEELLTFLNPRYVSESRKQYNLVIAERWRWMAVDGALAAAGIGLLLAAAMAPVVAQR